MKRLFCLAWLYFFALAFPAFSQPGSLAPTPRDRTISKVVETMLESNHLFKKQTDETLSTRGFDLFFKALDPNKVYFYQSDVDAFARRMKSKAQAGDVTFAFDLFNLYLKRVDERLDWAMAILDNPVDLSTYEEIPLDRKLMTYPKTEAEAQDRWMKQIKARLLALKAEEIEKLRDKAIKGGVSLFNFGV